MITLKEYGPKTNIAKELHALKYRSEGEIFYDCHNRISAVLGDGTEHRRDFRELLLEQKFLPAGRVQAAIGSPRKTTAFNCYVSGKIEDSFGAIMDACKEAGETMRLGGGIGYDFSTLRPKGERIKSLGSASSGPVSFMDIFDAICGTVSSAGHRRGAQMGVLRVDHPDILEFIHAKRNESRLTRFNVSVGITDAFMEALQRKESFDLVFEGKVYDTVDAEYLWDEIMRSTWDWAEPGVLFIDRINKQNNLWYCEQIAATNPCGEQPLPPHGACLLGSFNLTKYVNPTLGTFAYDQFMKDIPIVVRAMDNIFENTIYPLEEQRLEALNKRRMGLGVTGLANAVETMGWPYGTKGFLNETERIMEVLRDECYRASVELSKEKGCFPLFNDDYLKSEFVLTLPKDIQQGINEHGIRNSHLLSIAPTGTISLTADNISSGIEPVFTHEYTRTIQTADGPIYEDVKDYAWANWGVKGKAANEITATKHVDVLTLCQKYVDSSCSKTCNVGDDVTWEEFKEVYIRAYEQGAKGCTTFRASGKRYGILNEKKGTACFIDPETGKKECE